MDDDLGTDLVWDPAHSVKSPLLDAQHRRLLAMLNRVRRAVAAGEGGAVLHEELGIFQLYCQTHFDFEERILAFVGYPELEQHRLQHAGMRERCQALLFADPDDAATLRDLLRVLTTWWRGHPLKSDRKFVPWIERLDF